MASAYVFSNFFSNFGANFLANFDRPVLGCIDAKVWKYIFVRKLLTRSTRLTLMRLLEKRTEIENEIMKIYTLLHRSGLKKSAKFRQTVSYTFASVS